MIGKLFPLFTKVRIQRAVSAHPQNNKLRSGLMNNLISDAEYEDHPFPQVGPRGMHRIRIQYGQTKFRITVTRSLQKNFVFIAVHDAGAFLGTLVFDTSKGSFEANLDHAHRSVDGVTRLYEKIMLLARIDENGRRRAA